MVKSANTKMNSAVAVRYELDLPRILPERAIELLRDETSVSPQTANKIVMDLFGARPDLQGLAVVENGRPQGLINRNEFFARFARPYARELYLNKPCADFGKTDVLIFDGDTEIADIGGAVAERGEAALADGFIVTDNGRFAGLCSGITLVRALSDLQGEQHRQLLSGIDYASTIQSALLADSRSALQRSFRDRHGVLWAPRDVVGGDCFYAMDDADGTLIAIVDCTGHGVPGALLTSIALSEINRLVTDPEIKRSPAALLKGLNQRVKAALQQHDASDLDNARADDGMDAVFVYLDAFEDTLRIASAKLPVFLLDAEGELQTIKGDRKGVGYRDTPHDFEWSEHVFARTDLARLIMATDGLCDQIGEEKPIAFGWSRTRNALTYASNQPVAGQVEAVWETFKAYQGAQARRDDVTIVGLDFTQIESGVG